MSGFADEIHCFYCGHVLTDRGRYQRTRDHVTPKSKGGRCAGSNIVAACRGCNNEKGSLSIDEYRTRKMVVTFPGEQSGVDIVEADPIEQARIDRIIADYYHKGSAISEEQR